MTGRTLLHYEILEKLGEGGMGVVYKAQDTHLDRFVALKVLPAQALHNPDRKRRFVQEAKAASALNHPNIIHIYDIACADGVDFIAMEYVPGKTLEAWIGRKGLKVSEALKYAIQIADALAKAHAAGILHRDLKPANVMVNEDGLVKVLDFGLAKLTERSPIDGDQGARTVTLRPADTEEGTLLGTVAYMSPEQAEGKKLDARSDIFAFGTLLYELVTGRRAFQGESKLSTLTLILREDPKPPTQIAEEVPRELEKIILRCLRKDPDRRFQHMADLRVALVELKEESESGKLESPAPSVAARPRRRLAAGLAAVLGGAAVLAGVWWLGRPQAPLQPPSLTRLTFDSGLTFFPTISRDEKLLAYSSDRADQNNLDIWIQQMGGGQPLRLTHHPAADVHPDFSPDGTRIAFSSSRDPGGGVYVMPALGGGEERKIAAPGGEARFSPDGKWIAYTTSSALRKGSPRAQGKTGSSK